MRFRTKLLLLLLGISLLPMLLLRFKNQSTAQEMGREIAARIRTQLIHRSSMELEQQVSDHAFVMLRERQLLQLALRTQAVALEQLLAGQQPYPPVGDHVPLDVEIQAARHCRERGSGRCPPVPVDYARFSPLDVGSEVEQTLFEPLVPVFEDLAASYDDLVLWQYVFMPDGNEVVFPATTLRTSPDMHMNSSEDMHMRQSGNMGRGRRMGGMSGRRLESLEGPGSWMQGAMGHLGMAPDWHTEALKSNAPVWGKPHADPLTRKPVVTVSMVVRDPSGEPAASTAIVVEVGSLLRVDEHFDQLSCDLETLVVAPELPEADQDAGQGAAAAPAAAARLQVLARQDDDTQEEDDAMSRMRSWQATETQEWLESADSGVLAEVVADMQAGKAGVRELRYEGRDSLWAYGPIEKDGLSLLLIAPKEDLVAEADLTQEYVLQRFRRVIAYSGAVMGVMLALVVVLALAVSRRLTRHIEELARGFDSVGQGDFSVRVTVHGKDEIGQLAQGFNTMVPALEERIHMRQALDVAHEIQRNLLPQKSPQIPGFQVEGRSVYSESTGGDYYDCLQGAGGAEHDDAVGLVVGDVTGHGLPAAMLMTTARAFLRQRASMPGGPAEVLGDVNRQLSRDVDQTGRFMTLFYAVLEPKERILRWARAGHEPALLYSPEADSFEELGGEGLPLGTVQEWRFEQRERRLAPGELLCMVTDGVMEARSPSGEMYGRQRLQEVLRRSHRLPPGETAQALLEDLQAFRGQDSFDDDVTLLLLKAL